MILWVALMLAAPAPAAAEGPPMTMSLDDYVDHALRQGNLGLQNTIGFQTATYARGIALRQTSLPSLNYSGSGSLGETTNSAPPLDDVVTKTKSYSNALTLSEPLPTGTVLSLSGTYPYNWSSGSSGTTSQSSSQYNLQATQPLYIFAQNAVWRSRERARLQFDSARDSYEQEVLSIKAQARSLYYAVMLSLQSLEVAKRKLKGSRALLRVSQALSDNGKVAPVEVTRAEISVRTDERQLENAQASLDKAILGAKNFISLPVDVKMYFTTLLEFNPIQVGQPRLLDYALANRPEIRRQRRSLILAEFDLAETKEAGRPVFSLNGSYEKSLQGGQTTLGWTAGASATWLLFDSFVTRDRIRQSQLSLDSAQLTMADLERTTRVDVQSAYIDVMNAEKQIQDFKVSRDQAGQNVEIIRTRFQNGLDRLLDVFDAENQARDLDVEYLNLLVNHLQAKDRLVQLIGAPLESFPKDK